ncbi:putative 40S ribosomal protein S15-1 [Monocercomonoides exilis]|uniref:putative 40S ribosomal protein S15-1 n=1 Tax=Monocercomonoides exilis TaxID=2049356 RepID=UPI003559E4A1|nr:putative 40S ribosomal protein S15-1 [Monocercomonoides exilis]|eukprot:MONOS_12337.1-p1 / transcript=MONOS_12337.1 / gene=MONOS_12337 / organism=Monocercomonoides_exilis_PA203 / gene_product=40S ribosomal protein S15-1 / transcript_product=40S ribosomal protein S15-1 / location=Mono_scaffold00678:6278-6878(-) / protein_length=154 / sequence_SO=supercontig / SO=protein_coding / is_pseudo=false
MPKDAGEINLSKHEERKRGLKKFTYRGVELQKLLDLKEQELFRLFPARLRRKFRTGIWKRQQTFLKKLRKAKRNCQAGEKPATVKTHYRNMVVLPEMVGSMIGVHNGKAYNVVEIKSEMIGHYLGEFAITYKVSTHGRPGIGATHSSRFIPLK